MAARPVARLAEDHVVVGLQRDRAAGRLHRVADVEVRRVQLGRQQNRTGPRMNAGPARRRRRDDDRAVGDDRDDTRSLLVDAANVEVVRLINPDVTRGRNAAIDIRRDDRDEFANARFEIGVATGACG